MKTNLLKNIFLVWSWIAIATSTAIFASQQGISIDANLVNLVQYVKELYITSTGTPAGDVAFSVSHAQDGRWQVQADGYFTSIFTSGDISSTIDIETSEDGPRWHMMTLDSGNMINTIGFDKASDQILTTIQGADMVNWWGSSISASSLGTTSKYVVFDNYSNELRVDDAGITFWFEDNIQNSIESYAFPREDGDTNQVLTTDGAGQLSWADAGWSSSDGILFTGIFVSSNQIQNMWQNPVELLPEPGANKFIDVIDVIFKYNYGTTPYSAETLAAYFGWSPSEALFVAQYTATLDLTQNFFIRAQHASSFQNFAPDESFKLSVQSQTNPWAGDGTLEVYITYKIVDLLDL